MKPSSPHYFPLALPLLALFLFLLAVLLLLVEVHVLSYAYEKVGLHHRAVFGLLVASVLGSYVNIPVVEFPEREIVSHREARVFGVRYVVPLVEDWPRTVVAVNLGGALIPTLLSLYLLARTGVFLRAGIAVGIVTVVAHAIARPIPGLGIALPPLVTPIVAATCGILLARDAAPVVAYAAGTLGTLLGADLLNLRRIRGLGAPVASIGGAGTFDGIFLTGILAVLLA